MFAVDGYRYGGKDFDRRETVAELQAAMPTLEQTVVLREGARLDDELPEEIARRIRERCSSRYVPDDVFQITEVPRTLSARCWRCR